MIRMLIRFAVGRLFSAAVIMVCAVVAALWFYHHRTEKTNTIISPAKDMVEHDSKFVSAETRKQTNQKLRKIFIALIENQKQEFIQDDNVALKKETEVKRHKFIQEDSLGRETASNVQEMDNEFYARTPEGLEQCIMALETADPIHVEPLIQNLWILAADTDTPELALEPLQNIILQNFDPEVLKMAEFALADLQRLINMKERALEDDPLEKLGEHPNDELNKIYASESNSDGSEASSGQNELEYQAFTETQAKIEKYRDQALADPDELNRKIAIQEISNIRSETAVGVLISAAGDPNPENRYIALQALWYSAADGLETEDSRIWLCLKTAMSDKDAGVVEIATQAIDDLDSLEQKRFGAEHTMPPIEDELAAQSHMDTL